MILQLTESRVSDVGSCDTPLSYDARHAEIRGEQKGFDPNMAATELALLTVKENGSKREGYKSTSQATAYQAALWIGGRIHDECLIVSDTAEDGRLVHPAKLRFEDLVGYETLKVMER